MDAIRICRLDPDGFSARLLATHRSLFEAAVGHRLVREMSSGTLAEDAFVRYLVYEHAFVATAVTVNGYALAKAPDAEARRRIAIAAHELVTTQEAWFRDAFEAAGVAPRDREDPRVPTGVAALQDYVVRVAATQSFAETLATVLAAETMYATWCGRAAEAMPDDPRYAAWIAIHADEPFVEHVAWVGAWLDTHGPAVEASTTASVTAVFARTLRLEIGFHDAAYVERGAEPTRPDDAAASI